MDVRGALRTMEIGQMLKFQVYGYRQTTNSTEELTFKVIVRRIDDQEDEDDFTGSIRFRGYMDIGRIDIVDLNPEGSRAHFRLGFTMSLTGSFALQFMHISPDRIADILIREPEALRHVVGSGY